jgi:Sulfatase
VAQKQAGRKEKDALLKALPQPCGHLLRTHGRASLPPSGLVRDDPWQLGRRNGRDAAKHDFSSSICPDDRRNFTGSCGSWAWSPHLGSIIKPNIVFILADDLSYADVSCYGQRDYTTSNIDRLAIEGLRSTQGYSNSSDCSPTRTALITGRYQARLPVGLEEPITPVSPKEVGLPPSHPTLPSLLKKVGYGTALVGKWHLGYLTDSVP